jgi:protein O-GlcNAc transferase
VAILIRINDRDYSVNEAFEQGLGRHETGLVDQAEAIYRRILAVDPTHPDSLHLMGVVSHSRGQKAEAIGYYTAAIAHLPNRAPYHNNLGNTLSDLGRFEEAVAHYRTALGLRPGSAEIHGNLGHVLGLLGRWDEAMRHFRMALEGRPDSPEILCNLADALRRLGLLREAERYYRHALVLKPDLAVAHHHLGITLAELGQAEQAEAHYREALRLRADYPEALNDLGNLLQERSRLAEAVDCYRRSLQLQPRLTEAHYNLGCALLAQNDSDGAAGCYDQALALEPRYGAARLARCMAELPILYRNESEIVCRRDAYAAALRTLSDDLDRGGTIAGLAAAVGASQPFFLACQGSNDRELQALYGALACRLTAEAYPPAAFAPPPAPDEKIRVGIVSGFFREHTIWHLLIKGWVTQLDRSGFEVYGYHTGNQRDDETALAAAHCDRFAQGGFPAERWRAQIATDAPHVLIYPEIGMDPMSAHLAAHRLAPTQCVAWGHPDTSGMPSLDYFLGSDAMEPPDGQQHYTERLVRLPNLGTWYAPGDWPAIPLARPALGLRATATVYWSAQALHKYLPQFDAVFPRIALAVGDCQFVFIAFAKSRLVTDLFRQRLDRAFATFGLDAAAHCVILPSLPPERFVAAIGQCDIVLDTIGWSGGKSSLESLTYDRPIVTLAGRFMRGRHTAAMLRLMAVSDTIADTVDDYVAIAARLARDTAWRAAIGQRIAASKHRLYRDRAYIIALQEFLARAVRDPVAA